MTESASTTSPPNKILLATDLSARCDRALDRAVQLARQWQVPLLLVHALSRESADPWPTHDDMPSARPVPDPAALIERQLRRDLRDDVAGLAIHVLEGEPAEVILDVAKREGCELIVLGTARETFGRSFLGNTVEYLVRKSPASVLIVKKRPRGPYQHVLVGTDFTVESRHGLTAAAALFPQARFTLMHALDIPYQSLWLDAKHRQDFTRMEMATIESFVADAQLPIDIRQRIQLLVEHGPPEFLLQRYVLEQDADLAVIGAFRRGLSFHVLIGGTTRRLVQTIPSDILVVRAPASPAAVQPGESSHT